MLCCGSQKQGVLRSERCFLWQQVYRLQRACTDLWRKLPVKDDVSCFFNATVDQGKLALLLTLPLHGLHAAILSSRHILQTRALPLLLYTLLTCATLLPYNGVSSPSRMAQVGASSPHYLRSSHISHSLRGNAFSRLIFPHEDCIASIRVFATPYFT